jgi:hypothetical protein
MRTLTRTTWTIRSFLVVPLLTSLACSSSSSSTPAPTTRQSGVPATTAPTSTSPAGSSPPSTAVVSTPPGSDPQTFDASLVFGSGPFSLQTTTAGLAALASYTATLTLSFEGTRAGQPSTWSKSYVMLAMTTPAARQLTIQKSGDVAAPAQAFMAETNGAAYEKNAQDACTATVIAPDATLAQPFEPAGLLAGVVGADAAGSEAINGVSADHYTFDEHALGHAGRATAIGEMWVASDGGYIVKYLLTTKGDAKYFGEGVEGTLSWDYELTDIGQPVTITLPDDCPPGMLNVPQLPGCIKCDQRAGSPHLSNRHEPDRYRRLLSGADPDARLGARQRSHVHRRVDDRGLHPGDSHVDRDRLNRCRGHHRHDRRYHLDAGRQMDRRRPYRVPAVSRLRGAAGEFTERSCLLDEMVGSIWH